MGAVYTITSFSGKTTQSDTGIAIDEDGHPTRGRLLYVRTRYASKQEHGEAAEYEIEHN